MNEVLQLRKILKDESEEKFLHLLRVVQPLCALKVQLEIEEYLTEAARASTPTTRLGNGPIESGGN